MRSELLQSHQRDPVRQPKGNGCVLELAEKTHATTQTLLSGLPFTGDLAERWCVPGGQTSTISLTAMDNTVNVELNVHALEGVVGGVIHELSMDPIWAAKVESERFEIADLWADYASGN